MDVHAPSAADSVAIVVSDRVQPAHREGKRGALFMSTFYCIAIPAGIRSGGLYCGYQRRKRDPARAPIATTGRIASVYQVATNSGESSKQWKA